MMHKTTNSRFISINRFVNGFDNSENSPENSEDSRRSAASDDKKNASTSSSKRRRRRGAEKRVMSVPIKDGEGLRLKGDHMSTPPSDSWAWRKYGQKPIKGSPYPRAYYRCSSSKGCPARKQVERSKVDSNMLTVTYASEHNHPWPASRNNHHHHPAKTAAASVSTSLSEEDEEIDQEEEEEEEEKKNINIPTIQPQEHISEYKFPNLPLINASEFGWFTDFESTIEIPILTDDRIDTEELGMIFTMREEDEPLFADLGELPECSTVFRRGMAGREVEQRQQSLASTR